MRGVLLFCALWYNSYMSEKQCTDCKIVKPLEDFRNQERGKFGKRSKCKKCEYLKYKEYYSSKPEARRDIEKRYRQRSPEVFARRDKKYYEANKEKMLEQNKAWKAENPERHAELNRRKERVRRARKFENGIEPYTEARLLETYGTACHLCGNEIDLTAPRQVGALGWELGLHVDHLLPLSKGGADKLENVRPAHGHCNLSKGNTV